MGRFASARMNTDNVEIIVSSRDLPYVAAKRDLQKGELIEACPLVIFSRKDTLFLSETPLCHYSFPLGSRTFIPGGYGPLYLPGEDNNACAKINPEERTMEIVAMRNISRGHPILFRRCYGDVEYLVKAQDICTGSRKDGLEAIAKKREMRKNDPGLFKKTYGEFGILNPDFCHPPVTSSGLEVKLSPGRGFGTFATKHFKRGDAVEVCYVNSCSLNEAVLIQYTKAQNYVYSWGKSGKRAAWATGYPSFYNYSKKGNVSPWHKLKGFKWDHMLVKATRDIEPGEEIVFDYYRGWKRKHFSFEVKE
ncbi:hypothetical protein JW711_02515 [Candidatus Woesearchaeota archaeon]|nr:hypothetical protein [Candidatus Woesearchaeota archaeon]